MAQHSVGTKFKSLDELLLRYMSTFVGTSPFFRSALCDATETMQLHIAQISLYFRTIFFHIKVVSQNKLAHIRSFSDGTRLVQLAPSVLRNVHAVTYYRYKSYCTVYFGMDIMTYLF